MCMYVLINNNSGKGIIDLTFNIIYIKIISILQGKFCWKLVIKLTGTDLKENKTLQQVSYWVQALDGSIT